MADRLNMNDPVVRYEDVAGLRARISWAAVLAGSVIALAVYLLLTMLFAGLGLSLTDAGVRANTLGTGALIAGVISVVASLFVGGWVTTQMTAGETKQEAVVHGALTWATVVALSVAMIGVGVKAGYNALLGATYAAQVTTDPGGRNWEQAARDAGIPQERIDQLKRDWNPENVRRDVQNPETQEQIRSGAATATWVTFLGTLLSMAAAIGGALVGAGPSFRLIPAAAVRVEQREVTLSR